MKKYLVVDLDNTIAKPSDIRQAYLDNHLHEFADSAVWHDMPLVSNIGAIRDILNFTGAEVIFYTGRKLRDNMPKSDTEAWLERFWELHTSPVGAIRMGNISSYFEYIRKYEKSVDTSLPSPQIAHMVIVRGEDDNRKQFDYKTDILRRLNKEVDLFMVIDDERNLRPTCDEIGVELLHPNDLKGYVKKLKEYAGTKN